MSDGQDWGQPPGSGGGGFGQPPGQGSGASGTPSGFGQPPGQGSGASGTPSGFGQPPGQGSGAPGTPSGFGQPAQAQPAQAQPAQAQPMQVSAQPVPAKKSRSWIIIVAGLAFGGFCMVSCIFFGIFANKDSQEQQALWSGLRSYDPCNGRGAPGAAEYRPGGPPPHRMAAYDNGSWPRHPATIPTALRAERASATELVVCIGEEQEQEVESCSFHAETTVLGVGTGIVGSDTRTVSRQAVGKEVKIVVARTGEVLMTTRVWGGPPRSCDDDVDWEELSSSGPTVWRGGGPGDATIEDVVNRWSNGQPIEPQLPPGLVQQTGRAVRE